MTLTIRPHRGHNLHHSPTRRPWPSPSSHTEATTFPTCLREGHDLHHPITQATTFTTCLREGHDLYHPNTQATTITTCLREGHDLHHPATQKPQPSTLAYTKTTTFIMRSQRNNRFTPRPHRSNELNHSVTQRQRLLPLSHTEDTTCKSWPHRS
jgi:hypothetical protein